MPLVLWDHLFLLCVLCARKQCFQVQCQPGAFNLLELPSPSHVSGVFAARRIVLGNGEINRSQQVLELRTREWHGLDRSIVKRAVRPDQEDARLAKEAPLCCSAVENLN